MKAITSIMFFILLSYVNVFSQSELEQEITEVENGLLPINVFEGEPAYSLTDRMSYYQVPGISITVIKDYKVLWTKYYGLSDESLQTPVNEKTLFNVGSLSKGLASLTMLSLVQKGLIDLDEDVNLKLTSWKIPENEFTAKAKVTAKLLMNHSGGTMHAYATNYKRENFPTITQFLNGESPSIEKPTIIDRVPGTEFLYSNPGFAILQQLVEDVNHEPFYLTAKKNVFDILGMSSSTFQQPLPLEIEKYASAAHRKSSIPLPVKRYFYPNTAAGGLWTTTPDFAKYVIELQKSYHGKSNKIISQELTKEMLKTHVSPEYGFGLFIRTHGNEIYFGHMGDNAGFFAGFISHLSDGNAVIVFTNSNSSPELIREINKSVAKVYNWTDFLPEIYKIIPLNDYLKAEICGRYRSGSDEFIEIVDIDGALYLTTLGNEKLFHIGDNTFKIKRRAGEIKFIKDDNEQIVGAEYVFADEIGRISEVMNNAVRMKDGEKIPAELIASGKFEEAVNLYRKIFSENSNDKSISENRFNSLGYLYIGQKKYEHAKTIFELNIEFYPQSANCYDSYAEVLALMGNTEEAIKNYEKAIKLNPGLQNSRDMIKKLKEN
ncbi:MAG: beta-lactamase family protein [Bacteroidales bacterium]|nr:beta-lactamase family protein [Bacteroidales bacterium]